MSKQRDRKLDKFKQTDRKYNRRTYNQMDEQMCGSGSPKLCFGESDIQVGKTVIC